MTANDDTRVIGYFAFLTPTEVVCDGPACVISGSEKLMRDYIQLGASTNATQHTIKKTRFKDILEGLKLGAEYAFDEESYNRFYPLARKRGLSLGLEDFSNSADAGIHLVRVSMSHGT